MKTKKLVIEYDKEADAIYMYLSAAPYSYGKNLDGECRIDYDRDGKLRGVELLCVSSGVVTYDLPNKSEIERALGDKGIKVYS